MHFGTNRILRSLVEANIRVRRVCAGSDGHREAFNLIDRVFVRERSFLRSSEADLWDGVAHFYLLTSKGEPAGCVRIVDPSAFPEASAILPRRNARTSLPMEEVFPLDGLVGDCADWFEPGRFVLIPSVRRTRAFVALLATVYVYAVRHAKQGAVCLANPDLTESLTAAGWEPLGQALGPERYGEPAHPLQCWTERTSERYKDLFLGVESHGMIEIG